MTSCDKNMISSSRNLIYKIQKTMYDIDTAIEFAYILRKGGQPDSIGMIVSKNVSAFFISTMAKPFTRKEGTYQ